MGKRQSLQQMVIGKLDIHMQKNQVGPLPNTIYKSYLKKRIQDLNLRSKTLRRKQRGSFMNWIWQ